MNRKKLSLCIALIMSIPTVFANENQVTTLEPVVLSATQKKLSANTAEVGQQHIQSATTIGDALQHVSGVQSSAFGPNAGNPVIRSLSGNRVGIYENGQQLNGMNSFSGNISTPFSPLFTEKITIHKSSNAVRYGGHALGGSVDIDTGILSQKLEEKDHNLQLAYKKGFNMPDVKGIKLNFNNQKNLSTNIQFSRQEMSSYKIPGRSKAGICETGIFYPTGGINSSLADSCQKEARVEKNYNKSHQPYMNNYVLAQIEQDPSIFWDNYDGLEQFKYTHEATTNKRGKTYHNTPNPDYKPNTAEFVEDKISKDVTPNYDKKLGNSHLNNDNLAIGTTYFLDNGGAIGISFDRKTVDYGVPGFSLDNLTFQNVYKTKPVSVENEQNKYTLMANLPVNFSILDDVQFSASKQNYSSSEFLGASKVNTYKFESNAAELLLHHSASQHLKGTLGFNFNQRDIIGSGSQRYLPDVQTDRTAIFLMQDLNFDRWGINAGYRFETVDHQVNADKFKLSRNAKNTQLQDHDFDLNSYFASLSLRPTEYLDVVLKYSDSERAPDINELYASNIHYSEMLQEEGNQNLNKERAKNIELSTIFHIAQAQLTGTIYQTKFDDFKYLTNSGITTSGNRIPLKYWTENNTQINGFEIDASYVWDLEKFGKLKMNAFADLVKNHIDKSAEHSNNDGLYFSNMPTNRYGANLEWNHADWSARLSNIYYAKAQYLGKNINPEEPLPAYNLMDLSLSKKVKLQNANVNFFLNGSNLLNEEARPQNSMLKYIAPLPGRGFQLGVNIDI